MPVILIHSCHGFQCFFRTYPRSGRFFFFLFSQFQCLLKSSSAALGITVVIPDFGYMPYRIYFFYSDWVIYRVCFNLLLELISANTCYNMNLLIPFTIYIGKT